MPEAVRIGGRPPVVAENVTVVDIDRTDTATAASWVVTLTIGREVWNVAAEVLQVADGGTAHCCSMARVAAGMAALPAVELVATLDNLLDTGMAEDVNLIVWADSSVEADMRWAHIVADNWPYLDAIDWQAGKKQAEGEGRRGQWDSVASTD